MDIAITFSPSSSHSLIRQEQQLDNSQPQNLVSKSPDEAQDGTSPEAYASNNGHKRRRLLQSSADVSLAWQSGQPTSPRPGQGLSNATADRHSTSTGQPLAAAAPHSIDPTVSLQALRHASGWTNAELLQMPGKTAYSATLQPSQTQLYEISTRDYLENGWDFEDAAHLFDLLDANQPPTAVESLDPEFFNFEDIVHCDNFWPVSSPTPSIQSQLSQATTRPRHEIPNERFTRIQQLWPSAIKFSDFPVNLWKHVMALEHNNVVADSRAHSDQSPTRAHNGKTFKCGFDDLCRARLADDTRLFGPPVSTPDWANVEGQDSAFHIGKDSDLRSSTIHAVDLCSLKVPSTFPSTEVFGSSLDLYFRRFHTMMPFIHQPTFAAPATSSVVLYPMCLIGFAFLNDLDARRFVSAQIPVTINSCRSALASLSSNVDSCSRLLVALTSAVLNLSLATMVPDMVHDDSIQMLCVETLTIVQRYGLFRAYENLDITQDAFGNSTDETLNWQAWARVESTKRLIICLIMVDAFYAHVYGMRPVVRSDLAQFNLPCPSSLFEAPTASRWRALCTVEKDLLSSKAVLRRDAVSLPRTETFGMHGLLSLIWAKVLDAEYLLITSASASHCPYFTAPGEVFAEHDARDIAPLVQGIYEVYENTFAAMNPNCLVSWNDTCLKLTSNYRVFEIAAGCQGAEQARVALDHVARWSQTVSARRACLHAAQIYLIMSRRKTSDRIMFHSELAIFASALVLGFYLYALPKPVVVENERDDFELLEDVDWTGMGLVGLGGPVATISGAHAQKNAAKAFVEEGGNLSFDGVQLPGGLKSAQHIFLEFSSLLEDVGKWNVQKQCKVLRVLSDMSMEPAKFGMDDGQT